MLKITADGSADHGWTVEMFRDQESVWVGHPEGATEVDAVRAALAEWEDPTMPVEERHAAEAARLVAKAEAYSAAQVAAAEAARVAREELVAAERAAQAEALRQAEEERLARIAAEDAAARERNAADVAAAQPPEAANVSAPPSERPAEPPPEAV